MADKTTNYKLVKPDENDFYDINVFNDNADVLDKEIHKLDVPEFEDYTGEETVAPSAEEALQSMVKGKKLTELLGSMKAFCKGVITIGKLANRFDVVEEGYALDARAGKTLFDQVAQLNSNFTVVLPTSGWGSTVPYVQTLPLEGISPQNQPIATLAFSDNITLDEAKAQITNWYKIDRIVSGEDQITAYCYYVKPDADITIILKGGL